MAKGILEETGVFKVDIGTAPYAVQDTAWLNWNPRFTGYYVVLQNTNILQNMDLK